MNDSTQMNRPPISVIAQSGMLSKKLHFSMAVTISGGRTVEFGAPKPDEFIIDEIIP